MTNTRPNKPKVSAKAKIILIVSLTGVITTCLGLLGGKLPQPISDTIEKLGTIGWILAMLILTAAAIFASLWLMKQQEKKEANSPIANLTDEQRKLFIELLQKRYKRRLAQKTGERFALQIELCYTQEGIEKKEQLDIAAQEPGKPMVELEELLRKHKYLLLMGQPGSGKSTLLLSAATSLLQRAITNQEEPLPVIFNLANWTSDQPSLSEWMKNILIQGYAYPADLATKAVSDGSLLPLLDGLDEVGNLITEEGHRNIERAACLTAIHEYQLQRKSPKGMIICTRIAEYKASGGNAPVYAQLLLQPIDKDAMLACLQTISQGIAAPDKQEQTYEANNRQAALNLLSITVQNPTVAEVLCTPFYFNAALQVLHKQKDNQLLLGNNETNIKNNLLNAYVERKLKNNRHEKYTPEKTKRWLSWLAYWQSKRNDVSFELADFQPALLNNRWLFKIVLSLLAVLYGIAVGDFIGGFVGGFVGSLIGSLVGAFLFGLFFGLGYAEIETYDIQKWNWYRLLKIRIIVWPLFISLFIGLVLGLLFSSTLGFGTPFLIGFLIGIFFNLIDGSSSGLTSTIFFTELSGPYQRLWAGFLRTFVQFALLMLFLGIFLILYFKQAITSTTFIQNGLWTMLFGTISCVLMAISNTGIYQHLILNYFLFRENKLPYRMAPFFDYCADLGLLEKDSGGSWRFRHQLIQDYFLASYRTEHQEIEQTT